MSALLRDTWWMTQRRLAAFVRQPAYLIITLIQPAIWLFLFGNLFRKIVELPGFGTPHRLWCPFIVQAARVSSRRERWLVRRGSSASPFHQASRRMRLSATALMLWSRLVLASPR